MGDIVYVHYGHAVFNDSMFRKIEINRFYNKPNYGFWACRENAKETWLDFIDGIMPVDRNKSIKFTLAENAKVLRINGVNEVLAIHKKYPLAKDKFCYEADLAEDFTYEYMKCMINWVELAKDYDAVEVMETDESYYHLYGWDIPSICVFNKDVIVVSDETNLF